MIAALTRCTLLALAMFSPTAICAPIKLKLAFNTSDRSDLYLGSVKSFVDAVNEEADGLIEIDVYFSGVLAGIPPQPQLLLNGVADLAVIPSGQWQVRFPDDSVLELPGLFHDAREATLVYSRLVRAHALRGYEDFFAIGAFSSGPGSIHSRKRLTSLSDLKGMKIGARSATEAAVLERLGAVSDELALPQAVEAISAGRIDGAAAPLAMFSYFGIGRITTYHYLIPISAAPLAVLMNRNKFDSLPERAQGIIRKHSGKPMAARFIAHWQDLEKSELERIKSNERRTVTVPSPIDGAAAQAMFRSVNDEWAGASARNFELLSLVKKELARIRATQ